MRLLISRKAHAGLAGALILAGCATTTADELAQKPILISVSTTKPQQEVVSCIIGATPGLYVPAQRPAVAGTAVDWRQDPIGVVATFDVQPALDGSSVTVRQIGPIGRQLRKVAHCYM